MTASSRPSGKLPGYLYHASSGRARVRVNGEYVYISGKYGSPESRQKYGELIAEMASGVEVDPLESGDEDAPLTVNELILGYIRFAEGYYVKNGRQTDEVGCIKSALKPLRELYGYSAAEDLGPKRLKVVRQMMVDSGKKCRRFINQSIGRIRRCFRWAVENELIDASVVQALEAVAPLKAGRCDAKDHPPRHPVPRESIDAVKAVVKQRTSDIMELMELCGARPGEVVKLTQRMIDQTGDVWSATLDDHKTVHRGKTRTLYFGLRCQVILRKYFSLDPDRRLFPITRAAASAAIKKACADLGIKRFTGHWLRHNALTNVRKSHGLDASQAVAGHASAEVTQVYAALDDDKARQVARDVG